MLQRNVCIAVNLTRIRSFLCLPWVRGILINKSHSGIIGNHIFVMWWRVALNWTFLMLFESRPMKKRKPSLGGQRKPPSVISVLFYDERTGYLAAS